MRWILSIIIGLVIWLIVIAVIVGTMSWAADRPGSFENGVMTRIKYWRVGGKNMSNPSRDTPDTAKEGAEHFQHHCQLCHGLDGQNTGVPIATRTLPPVADLSSARVQKYTDGQLKWIIDNGIRFSGMPGWKGILSDEEAWNIVVYIRHLPTKGSLGAPKVFQEAEEEHEHGTDMKEEHKPENQPHQHTH
jgi:mono/diheme cytochrome c family protein